MTSLHTEVVNALEEHIAVIDQAGKIVDVNQAWMHFGKSNGLAAEYAFLGRNYFAVFSEAIAAGDQFAKAAKQGIEDVMKGAQECFEIEYPCTINSGQSWFEMRVVHIVHDASDYFVITHRNISQRKQAEYQAMHDPLTGLANRRLFNHTLNQEIQRGNLERFEVSLILVDVDCFKAYNDAYGHSAGDECLMSVGLALQEVIRRPGDLASRVGGDEFALILANASAEDAQKIAEDVLNAFSRFTLKDVGACPVTVSIGVVTSEPSEFLTSELLYLEADKALYRAKFEGRNRFAHTHLHPSFVASQTN